MSKESKKLCDAILGLIHRISTDKDVIPDGFKLSFGDENIKITADINLDYEITNKSKSDEIINEFIINRMMGDDKKE